MMWTTNHIMTVATGLAVKVHVTRIYLPYISIDFQ